MFGKDLNVMALQLHTYWSVAVVAVMKVGCVGKAVEVQLGLSVVVKLQPSMVSDRGRVIAGGGGYITDAMLTPQDTSNPDTRLEKPPFRKTADKIS